MKLVLAVALCLAGPGFVQAQMADMSAMRPTSVEGGAPPRILPGLGSGGYDPERATPAARAEFDNGVRLNNAFNEPEAVRAFVAAQRLDPRCALCFWGEAAARAPTINYNISPAIAAQSVAALDRASALSAGLSPKGQGLIAAERARYVRRGAGWAVDDAAEAKAAEALADRFPADDALQVAAADADMIAAGRGRPGSVAPNDPILPSIQARLETVLARSPDYTPALHFYLHLMEWEGRPEKAYAYAGRLGALAPESGHLLHMASHIDYHTGRYEEAVLANAKAARADVDYVSRVRPPGGMGALPMHQHNLAFGLGATLLSGDVESGLRFAREMHSAYKPQELVSARSYIAFGRYLPVTAMLAMPVPRPALPQAFYRYGLGEALARRGDAAAVLAQARAIEDLRLHGQFGDEDSRVVGMLQVASLTLVGRAAMLRHDWPSAIGAYRAAAVYAEANEPYGDPPLWPWSPRRSLAEALLASGDANGARREAEQALKAWPEDGVTLHVLAQAMSRTHDPAAPSVAARSRHAWMGPVALLAPAMI